jgi:hypothetical protein
MATPPDSPIIEEATFIELEEQLNNPSVFQHARPVALDDLCRQTKFTRQEIRIMYRGFKQVGASFYRCFFRFLSRRPTLVVTETIMISTPSSMTCTRMGDLNFFELENVCGGRGLKNVHRSDPCHHVTLQLSSKIFTSYKISVSLNTTQQYIRRRDKYYFPSDITV